MSVYRFRRGPAWAAALLRAARDQGRLHRLGARVAHGGLFIRAEMDNHMWTEALRGRCAGRLEGAGAAFGLAFMRTEVSEEVLRGGHRCLRLGRCSRLVSGPLAGCVGILLPEADRCLSLHIVRHPPAWEGAEYVESVH